MGFAVHKNCVATLLRVRAVNGTPGNFTGGARQPSVAASEAANRANAGRNLEQSTHSGTTAKPQALPRQVLQPDL